MLRTRLQSYRLGIRRRWHQLDPTTRALPRYLLRAVANFQRLGLQRAASLAYYAIFSIFPLSLLVAVTIGSILGPTVAQEQIARGLGLFLPPSTLDLFQTNVADALTQGRSFGLLAIAGLVWSGLGLFANITSSLDLIFHVPASRSIWRQRLIAIAMTLILMVLITASFVTSGILRLVLALSLERPSSWLLIAGSALPFGIDMVIFALLFRYVPAKHVQWDAVWPAAIFGAGGWELLKSGFNWYLENLANYQFVYGGIATVIILLFWTYLIASIFLLSAECCAQLDEWMSENHRQADTQRFLDSKPLSELPQVIETENEEAY